jgi:hypothetical protein
VATAVDIHEDPLAIRFDQNRAVASHTVGTHRRLFRSLDDWQLAADVVREL